MEMPNVGSEVTNGVGKVVHELHGMLQLVSVWRQYKLLGRWRGGGRRVGCHETGVHKVITVAGKKRGGPVQSIKKSLCLFDTLVNRMGQPNLAISYRYMSQLTLRFSPSLTFIEPRMTMSTPVLKNATTCYQQQCFQISLLAKTFALKDLASRSKNIYCIRL